MELGRRPDVLDAIEGTGARLSLLPEPDLPALIVSDAWKADILRGLPEMPEARRARMIAAYGISEQDAMTFTATRAFADQFEAAAKRAQSPRRVASC